MTRRVSGFSSSLDFTDTCAYVVSGHFTANVYGGTKQLIVEDDSSLTLVRTPGARRCQDCQEPIDDEEECWKTRCFPCWSASQE